MAEVLVLLDKLLQFIQPHQLTPLLIFVSLHILLEISLAEVLLVPILVFQLAYHILDALVLHLDLVDSLLRFLQADIYALVLLPQDLVLGAAESLHVHLGETHRI